MSYILIIEDILKERNLSLAKMLGHVHKPFQKLCFELIRLCRELQYDFNRELNRRANDEANYKLTGDGSRYALLLKYGSVATAGHSTLMACHDVITGVERSIK